MLSLSLATSYPKSPQDGTAPFIRAITHGLCEYGVQVHILLPNHPDLKWVDRDPPAFLHRFKYAPTSNRYLHVWGYAGGLKADKQLRMRSFAVLPFAMSSCLLRLLSLSRQLKPDLIHCHWVLPNGPIAATVARMHGLPLVISLHGSGLAVAERNPLFRTAAAQSFQAATCITACSKDLRQRAISLGADPGKVIVIPYGVDVDAIKPGSPEDRAALREELGLAENVTIGLAIGRMVGKKGFDRLIDAVSLVRDSIHLVIAGGGDLQGKLERQAAEAGIAERVRFLGSVDRARVHTLLRSADLFVVPSVKDESGNVDGLPNVLLEGMAAGLPIVASRIAGIPDVIDHDVTGLLVPPGNSEMLARAIDSLVASKPLRSRLGQAARTRAELDLSWRCVSKQYHSVLEEATNRMSAIR